MNTENHDPNMRIVDQFAAPHRSPSAEMVAVMRAAHQVIDAPPLIHADPLALRIIGARARRWLEDNKPVMQKEYVRRIRGMVAIRSRLCEDELRHAVGAASVATEVAPTVGRGMQYVVLGAGLDTFAYRSAELAAQLTVFEVDQPGTQAWKIAQLREAGIDIPSNLRFVPVDFNEGTLARSLAAAGFERAQPAFFAWLGVSYYLPRESITAMLGFIASQDAASKVVFDIALEESAVPLDSRDIYWQLRRAMSTAGESWQTWLEPEELRSTMRALGFTEVEVLDWRTLSDRFLAGRTDDLLPGPAMAMVVGRTGEPPRGAL